MYLVFPENLPASIKKATFELISDEEPSYCFVTPDTEISNRSISIAIPDQASHIRCIRFRTARHRFYYYYPEGGYAISKGFHLPDLIAPQMGDHYAGGVVIQLGTEQSVSEAEPDILPYKGTVIAIHEKNLSYQDALIYCESISDTSFNEWRLPDAVSLTQMYNKQQKISTLLLQQQGTMLCDEEYWCRDNSVTDLGVAFSMATGMLYILSKKEKRQVRPICNY